MTAAVGVDLGGTKILAALVDDDHRVVAREKLPTPTGGPEAVVKAMVEAVRALPVEPTGVGVGAPGPVNDGMVMTAVNLVGWTDPVPLADRLGDALGVPVAVANDANVAALGEWAAGAAQGARAVLGVWLGTGVGGGLVFEGRPYLGAFGGAGEFGHITVQREGALCGCGRRGCVEAYAGRASLERSVEVLIAAGETTALTEIAAAKGKRRLTSSVWSKALTQEDPMATRLFEEAVEAVGIGVADAINLLDLDCVVIGGGFAESLGQRLADLVAEAAQPHILVTSTERRIVVTALAENAGVIGAAALVRDRFN